MFDAHDVENYRDLFVGTDTLVPVLNGNHRIYVNLDNAASTPPMKSVRQAVDDFLPYYSSVHRGTGYKSQISTHVYENSRSAVLGFVNASPDEHTCIFGKNTTEAINKLARRFPFSSERDVVLTTMMEHHSNDLPWRNVAHTVHIGVNEDGRLDESDLQDKLENYNKRIALIAITGATNVTGYINPIHQIAEQAHAAGAMILVDAAQLAPHRRVDMRALADPGHLDFLVISAHKMYAPFGTGALVGRKDVFNRGTPDVTGGGTVMIVTVDDVVWATAPDRDEAGSPNTVGALALAAAIRQLGSIGMDKVARHEADLTAYALKKLSQLEAIRIYGDKDPANSTGRIGSIPLELEGMSHFKLAAILGYEYGIGVRSGCFCAHPYLLKLLDVTGEEAELTRSRMQAGDKSEMPGLVRLSFGLYNTRDDIDVLVEALVDIIDGKYQGEYKQDRASGEYYPQGWQPDFDRYFMI